MQSAYKSSFPKWIFLAILPLTVHAEPVTVFSGSGFILPETITPVPSGFGFAGGNYFVPDASANQLFVLPLGGGAPAPFAALAGDEISGIFVPPGYGSLSGQFLVTGNGNAQAIDASGVVTNLSLGLNAQGSVVAPGGFGSVGGKILIGDDGGDSPNILVVNADLSTSVFATLPDDVSASGFVTDPFGMGFAPAGFGSIGGNLLVTDATSGNIYTVDALGSVSLFSTVPLPDLATDFAGLRQFAFAPAGFGAFGGDLFVSVSGSSFGGGSLGKVDVLDSSGIVIATLLEGTLGRPYDPRGLYFVGNDQLLIADADPGILSATPSAFTTPEPSTEILSGLGLLAIISGYRQRRKR